MKRKQLNALLSIVSLFSLLFNAVFTASAQIGGATEDISEGASVFVFHPTSRAPKSALRNVSVRTRTTQKKSETRDRRIKQSNFLSEKRPIKPVNPKPTPRPVKLDASTMSKEKAAEELAKAAENLLKNKDWDEAENQFAQARALNPSNETARLGLARLHIARGNEAYEGKNYKAAVSYYKQAVGLDAENADAFAGLGEAYDAQNDNDNGIQAYLNALKLDESLTEINAPLGTLYYEKGNFAEAAKYLAKAVSINPNDDDLQNLYGESLVKEKREADAAKAFQTAISLNQDNAVAHYNLAKIHAGNNRHDDAITELRKAISLNKNYQEAYFDLATLLYNNEKYDEAATNFKEVLRINSGNNEARLNLADTYRAMNKYGQAVNEYNIIAPIQKKAEIYSDYGYVLGKSGNWTGAINTLKEAVKLEPNAYDYTNLAWAYNNAAKSSKEQALFEEAKRAAQEAIKLNPNFAAAYYNLGNAQAQSKDYQGAIQSFNKALELRNNWVDAINNLGVAYANSGDHQRAIEEYRKALKSKPNFELARYHLGVSLAINGNFKDAENEMKELSKTNQSHAKNLAAVINSEKRKRGGK